MNAPVKVLYIMGFGRSGTTILDNLLGQVEGFFSVGELRFIWDRNIIQDRLCGCGVPFSRCSTWSAILKRAYGNGQIPNPYDMVDIRDSTTRMRHFPLLFLPGTKARIHNDQRAYREQLSRLYTAIAAETQSRVIIDSSKFPLYGGVLKTVPGIELYILHVVRDPRGAAYSWKRKKQQVDRNDKSEMPRYSVLSSAIHWVAWNWAAEYVSRGASYRYMRLRYEDLVARPKETVRSIVQFANERPGSLPFLDETSVQLRPNHTTSGNPNRFITGVVQLRPDIEWRRRMSWTDRAIVTGLTWPLLIRYEYVMPKAWKRIGLIR